MKLDYNLDLNQAEKIVYDLAYQQAIKDQDDPKDKVPFFDKRLEEVYKAGYSMGRYCYLDELRYF